MIAIDKKGKEIKDFKKEYPGLMPRIKAMRLKYDLNRMKATDLNSGRSYKIIFHD